MSNDILVALIAVGGGIIAGWITAVFKFRRYKYNHIQQYMMNEFRRTILPDIIPMFEAMCKDLTGEIYAQTMVAVYSAINEAYKDGLIPKESKDNIKEETKNGETIR